MSSITYQLRNTDASLFDATGNERVYIMKIRDMPMHEKPREKILATGVSSLSSHELLAVVLGVGTKKEDVLAMASRVLKEYGERSFGTQINPNSLSVDLDIPLNKAIQIVACAELGRRFFDKRVGKPCVIRTAKDVYIYCRAMGDLLKEHLRGIYLNAHHRVVHDEVISIGTVNSNIIHPREVFKPALEYSAVALVLAHNHPSGSATPSNADVEITRQIVHAGKMIGVDLLDHVIITSNNFYSIQVEYA